MEGERREKKGEEEEERHELPNTHPVPGHVPDIGTHAVLCIPPFLQMGKQRLGAKSRAQDDTRARVDSGLE